MNKLFVNSLSKISPQISYPIKWLIIRWSNDPFSYGSYSSFHWGGEHINWNGSIGYVQSAFEIGIREFLINFIHKDLFE
jgi:hypothetical protein